MSGQGQVHAWPLITLRYTATGATASCGTKHSDVQTEQAGSLEDAARQAAVEVCVMLKKDRCRVEGIADDGTAFTMVVDAAAETLEPLDLPAWGGATQSRTMASGKAKPMGSRARSRPGGLRLNKRQAGYVLAAAFVVVGGGVMIWSQVGGTQNTAAQEPPLPGPAQLPVAAPAGWSTYANWSVPGDDAPAVLDAQGRLLVVEEGQVVARDPETGRELQRLDVPFGPDQLMVYVEGGHPRVAAATGRELAVLNPGAESFVRVDMPDQAEVLLSGSEPLVVNREQRAWVLEGHALRERIVPAGAEAISAEDGALIAASEDGDVWKITNSDAELPEPTQVKAPKGYEVVGIPAGYGSRIVVNLDGEDDNRLAIYEVIAAETSTEATELVSEVVESNAGTGQPDWDPSSPLVALGSVAVDFDDVAVTGLPEAADASAGHLWVEDNDGTSQQFSSAGTQLDSGDTGAGIPSVITAGGLAIVLEDGRLYAVTETPPPPEHQDGQTTSTATESTTDEQTNEGEDQ